MANRNDKQSRNLSSTLSIVGMAWLLTTLSLVFLNLGSFSQLLAKRNNVDENFFHDIATDSLDTFTHALDALPFIETIVTFLFWMLVGFIVYGLLVTAGTLLWSAFTARSLVKDYHYPSLKSRESLIHKLFINWALVIAIGATFLFTAGLSLFFVLPISRSLFMNGFYKPTSPQAWASSIGATLFLVIMAAGTIWMARLFWRARNLLTEAS